jgi:fructokinase
VLHIGIDLGGTKIEIVALDGTGSVRYRERTATPRDDYPGTVRAMADLVRAPSACSASRRPSASACRARSRPPPGS